MKWIIRHEPSGRYIVSKRLTVRKQEFARKFNSEKQAKIFVNGSLFLKSQCKVIEYTGYEFDAESEEARDKELAYRIRQVRILSELPERFYE